MAPHAVTAQRKSNQITRNISYSYFIALIVSDNIHFDDQRVDDDGETNEQKETSVWEGMTTDRLLQRFKLSDPD